MTTVCSHCKIFQEKGWTVLSCFKLFINFILGSNIPEGSFSCAPVSFRVGLGLYVVVVVHINIQMIG